MSGWSKCSRACNTVISRTSAMDVPLNLYASTSSLKRLPPQISHGDFTLSKKDRSVYTTPKPWQFSQAPLELKLNRPASTLLALAKALRTSSIMPVYVAGLEREDTPTADWSITIASGCWCWKTSLMRELLPEPATPVTTVNTPVGMFTLTFCRLLIFAFLIGSLPVGVRNESFNGMDC